MAALLGLGFQPRGLPGRVRSPLGYSFFEMSTAPFGVEGWKGYPASRKLEVVDSTSQRSWSHSSCDTRSCSVWQIEPDIEA